MLPRAIQWVSSGRQPSLQSWQQTPRHLPRVLRHQHIHHHQTRHSLNNRHRPRHNARIMSSLRLQHSSSHIIPRRLLRQTNRRRRFKRNPEIDLTPITNPTLNAPRIIRRRCESSSAVRHRLRDERVIMNAAGDLCTGEARPDFEAFSSWDGEHGVSEHSFEFVEDRLAEADGTVADHACDGAADGVFGVAVFLD